MWDMTGSHVSASRVDVVWRVVEENVGAERFQERPLLATTQEQCLVEAHAPLAQCPNHAFMRGCGARSDQRGADGCMFTDGERHLQVVQR